MTSSPTEIQLSSCSEVPAVASSTSKRLLVMANLKAPVMESRAERAPVSISAVIDKSGSMEGEKLALTKKTLGFVITQLNQDDEFGVVAFSDHVHQTLGLARMDANNRRRAQTAVTRLRADGMTNLSGGLFLGMDQLKGTPPQSSDVEDPESVLVSTPLPPAIVTTPPSQAVPEERNDICAVWLFTDGQANVGITNREELVQSTNERMQGMAPPCSVFTFGFGSDHDSRMLKDLSDAGHGMYYFVKDESSIAEAFADCLGGLLSVVARNIRLTATAQPGCTIRRVHTKFQQEMTGNVVVVTIPDLYSEEERDIILEVEVAEVASPEPAPAPLMTFDVEYHNVLTDQPERGTSVIMLSRPQEAPASAVHPKLDQQRNRVVCLEAIEVAQRLADNRQLAEARQTLDVAVGRITQSVTAAEPLCVALVEDLRECHANLRDQHTYGATGTHMMSNNVVSHGYQRCCGNARYQTSMKQEYSAMAQNW